MVISWNRCRWAWKCQGHFGPRSKRTSMLTRDRFSFLLCTLRYTGMPTGYVNVTLLPMKIQVRAMRTWWIITFSQVQVPLSVCWLGYATTPPPNPKFSPARSSFSVGRIPHCTLYFLSDFRFLCFILIKWNAEFPIFIFCNNLSCFPQKYLTWPQYSVFISSKAKDIFNFSSTSSIWDRIIYGMAPRL